MAPLPRGTVTLVFSDIEGSTRLLRELRGGYADVLAEHRVVLREAYERHGGRVVDSETDATSAVFRRAADALAGAAEAQRALASHSWPLPLRVRMGVHTGEPEIARSRYFGLAVNRAARICAAAHGGQVLVSEATAVLAASDELRGVTLADRGTHRLKDFDTPERLFQLNIEGLPSHFPPLRVEPPPQSAAAQRKRWPYAAAAALLLAAAATTVGYFVFGGAESAPAVTDVPANSVAVIDASRNEVVGVVPVGRTPWRVSAGGGNAWVANADDGTLSQIDPRRLSVVRTVSIPRRPGGIAVADGILWVGTVLGRRSTALVHIDPVSGARETFARVDPGVALYRFNYLDAVKFVVADRRVAWVGAGRYVVRIDAATRVQSRLATVDDIKGLGYGYGTLWVADGASQTLIRLDPRTGQIRGRTPLPGIPSGLAIGEGGIWVPVTVAGLGNLLRVDPYTGSISASVELEAPAHDVAAGDGGVWLVLETASVVVRVEPSENRVVATLPLPNRPDAIAVGEGYVWVTVY